MLHNNTVNSEISKRCQFVAQIQNAGRSLFWGEEFFWMRLKGHDAADQASILGAIDKFLKQGAMTPVHAIEITDG
ncbi:hypothetical protein PKF032_15510 [Polynucleobacter yangtzensis]|uniref:Uncharacterized protein n=1 Tax=Polynucleobacter yangtzensis TaxID=1743159 RepID=A0ABN6TUC7_9BURK|nr:hypothetical protein PKF032_15510 [Polynucleobacter yangtzensis]